MSKHSHPNIVFYISDWIDDEDFELFLQFARYLGKEQNKAKFIVDVNRLSQALREKKISPSDVLDLLLGYDAEFEGGTLDDIKKLMESYMPTVTIEKASNSIYLKPNFYLGDLVKDLREKHILIYDRDRKSFKIAKPMYLFQVIDVLKRRGVEVINASGIKREEPLPVKPSFKGTLRDYQQEALDAWRKNGYRGIIALPTGTGKTIIAIAAVAELGVKTLIVTFTKEQMFQWADKIIEFTDMPKSMIGFFYANEKRLAPVTITTYHSAYRYVDMLAPHFSLLIIDEVHHLPADKFRIIAESIYADMRMGLSATVVREDGRHVELFPLMGGVVYAKTLQELAEKGYVAPFKVTTIRVQLTLEEKSKYKELLNKYRRLAREREFKQLVEDAKKGDVEAIEALKVRSELRELIANSERKLEAIRKIVNEELAKGSKILIFTQYIEQAKRIAEMLNTYYIIGELDENVRKMRLELFKSGIVRVLVLTTVGDEGLDIPDANVGIIAAGTGSRRQFVQRLGRLLRPAPGKEARLYEIIVRGTYEEAESRKRREALQALFDQFITFLETGA
ncbi:MAG: DEAD/DEAH box helicase [Ignisphaera sp.]|nr:DEAD/DEAH box helicase [Ignisphaera sp.]